jgi:serine/threonine protein phosphatase PrpC
MCIVPVAALCLVLLAGGFPPRAWVLLFQALPHLSALLVERGPVVVLALIGLVLISAFFLLAWGTLGWLAWRMLAYWWYERRELQQFAFDAAEANYRSTGPLVYEQEEAFALAGVSRTASVGVLERRGRRPAQGGRWDEDDFEEEQGYVYEPAIYPDEEASDDRGEYDEADDYQDEEAEEETAMGVYQDEDLWEDETEARGNIAARAVATTRQPAAQGPVGTVKPVQVTSYGRFISTHAPEQMPSPPVPRLNTTFYDQENAATLPLNGMLSTLPPLLPTIQLVVSTGLDVGLRRKGKPNEDSLLALQNTRVVRGCSSPVGLFVIADGMGGHENGQEASRTVIQSLSKTVVPSIIYGPTDDDYAELLAEGVHHANLAVYQRNREERADMGTTLAAALVVNTTAYVVNVGDSRVYLYRPSSGLTQITRDHSTVARLVESGVIQPEEVYTHPRRNEIYRSLGHHPSEEIDRFTLALQTGDLLLLCSDGLWEMVRDPQIQEVIESMLEQPTQMSTALIQAALDGGGKDNVSVIVVCIRPAEEQVGVVCAD